MYTATEITKAAKCLKDNPNFKSVYINPDLTQSQKIHLKRLIKERTQKTAHSTLLRQLFVMVFAVIRWSKSKIYHKYKIIYTKINIILTHNFKINIKKNI